MPIALWASDRNTSLLGRKEDVLRPHVSSEPPKPDIPNSLAALTASSDEQCRTGKSQSGILRPHFHQPGRRKTNVMLLGWGGVLRGPQRERERESLDRLKWTQGICFKTGRYRENVAFDPGL